MRIYGKNYKITAFFPTTIYRIFIKVYFIFFVNSFLSIPNPLSANPTIWSNILKEFLGFCRRDIWVCLTILWGWRLRIHWRLLAILKTRNKSVWSNVFWYVKVDIFWKFIQYTILWDKAQMLKKFPLDKMNGTKNALFFLSRALTHNSFTVTLRFLYELKHKVPLSKMYGGFSFFHFVSFLLKFIFLFKKMIFKLQQEVWKFNDPCVSWSSPKTDLEANFLHF